MKKIKNIIEKLEWISKQSQKRLIFKKYSEFKNERIISLKLV